MPLLLVFILSLVSTQGSFQQSTDQVPSQFLDKLDDIYNLYFELKDKKVVFVSLDSLLHSTTAKNSKEAHAEVLSTYASLLLEEGKYTESIENANDALALLTEKNNLELISRLYLTQGNSYDYLGFYPKAIEYILKALKISESLNDIAMMGSCYNNLANIQSYLNEFNDAKRNYFTFLNLAILRQDSTDLGAAYINIGGLYLLEEKFDSAKFWIDKANQMASIHDNKSNRIYSYGALSDYYSYIDDIDSAIYYQKISSALSVEYGTYYEIANEQISLATLLLDNNELEAARVESVKALDLSLGKGLKEIVARAYDHLFFIDSINGDYKNALRYYQQSVLYFDSAQNEEVAKDAVRQQLVFDFEKKDALSRLEIEKQERQRNFFIMGFLLMTFASGIILVQRNRISKEKNRSESLLLNILPYETAQELKDKGYADSKHIDQVTVLFTDFQGFTQISEILSPQELVANIHECFSEFDKIMEKHNVEKIKTIGDAYMAAGGLPTPNQTNAVEVVRAALDIQEFMNLQAERKSKNGEPHFKIRIGIHTGSVVAGIVGIKKFQYDIWGDTVNTASRMESSGSVGQVNISGFTYSLVKDHFTCTYRGEIEAKGKGKIAMYFVSNKID